MSAEAKGSVSAEALENGSAGDSVGDSTSGEIGLATATPAAEGEGSTTESTVSAVSIVKSGTSAAGSSAAPMEVSSPCSDWKSASAAAAAVDKPSMASCRSNRRT